MADKKPIVLNGGQQEVIQSGDLIAISAIATGTPDGTKFIRDDGTLAVPAGGSGLTMGKTFATAVNYNNSISTF
jgi:hypothetical protein